MYVGMVGDPVVTHSLTHSLPANIRDSPSLPTFRRHLKTHYFQLAYLSPWRPPPSQRTLIV